MEKEGHLEDEHARAYCGDLTLLRYLRARDHHLREWRLGWAPSWCRRQQEGTTAAPAACFSTERASGRRVARRGAELCGMTGGAAPRRLPDPRCSWRLGFAVSPCSGGALHAGAQPGVAQGEQALGHGERQLAHQQGGQGICTALTPPLSRLHSPAVATARRMLLRVSGVRTPAACCACAAQGSSDERIVGFDTHGRLVVYSSFSNTNERQPDIVRTPPFLLRWCRCCCAVCRTDVTSSTMCCVHAHAHVRAGDGQRGVHDGKVQPVHRGGAVWAGARAAVLRGAAPILITPPSAQRQAP